MSAQPPAGNQNHSREPEPPSQHSYHPNNEGYVYSSTQTAYPSGCTVVRDNFRQNSNAEEDTGTYGQIMGGGGSLESGVEWTWSYPIRNATTEQVCFMFYGNLPELCLDLIYFLEL
jgi:hypothetical protein